MEDGDGGFLLWIQDIGRRLTGKGGVPGGGGAEGGGGGGPGGWGIQDIGRLLTGRGGGPWEGPVCKVTRDIFGSINGSASRLWNKNLNNDLMKIKISWK